MNRALTWFLLFLALLTGSVAAGVWWIGWDLLGLAFDADRRATPYGLLLLSRQEDDDRAEHRRLLELLAADGGQAVWQARTLSLIDGSLRDDWQRLTVVRFDRGAGVTRALTGGELRGRLAERNRLRHPRRQLLGSAALVDLDAPAGVVLLGLFAQQDAGQTDARTLGFASSLDRYRGQLLWQGPVTDLVGESRWARALFLRFPAADSALQWLQDPQVETALALGARHYRDRALLLARPQAPVAEKAAAQPAA